MPKPSLVRKVDRVAIAVRDLDRARKFFEEVFGARFEAVEDVKDMKFRYQPFTLGGFKLELLCPYDPSSVIARFLERRGEGVHHISFDVANLDAAIAELAQKGVSIAYRHRYAPDVYFEGLHWDEAFVHPKDGFGVLLHLAEKHPLAARKAGGPKRSARKSGGKAARAKRQPRR
jgi:methylmalonyl-CoA/ethylmalonyl-CoA epimerase